MISRLFPLVLVFWSGYIFSKELDVRAKDEIDHLLSFIEASPCDFNRNGTWYSARKAGDHIKSKYKRVLDKGLVDSAEDFIEFAATKSSVSGKHYMIKCAGAVEIKSSDWLKQELSAFRALQK